MTQTDLATVAPEQATPQEILESHFTLAALPDAIEILDVEGADGWTSPNPHPALSLGRWATGDKEIAAAALDQILERFKKEGRGFDWMTGPRCADAGLVPLLTERGFINPPLDVAGMVKQISPHDKPSEPDGVHIWKVDDIANPRIWGVMAEGFDIPDDVAAIFHNAYAAPSKLQRTDFYAASVDGADVPVGVGYLSYIGDGTSALLRVSCTLEKNRGRGIYRAVVNRRLYDAAEQGCTQVFVHAYSAESKGCLEQLGFVNAGELQLHRWRP